ncbi:hypothetical protein ACHAQJ_003734 [Trichoderma viride]
MALSTSGVSAIENKVEVGDGVECYQVEQDWAAAEAICQRGKQCWREGLCDGEDVMIDRIMAKSSKYVNNSREDFVRN